MTTAFVVIVNIPSVTVLRLGLTSEISGQSPPTLDSSLLSSIALLSPLSAKVTTSGEITMRGLAYSLPHFFVALLSLATFSTTYAQGTCSIDGITYARGDTVLRTSRCGPIEDYPCVCNPDVSGEIDCPFCSWATSTPNHLRCAKDGESAEFVDINGIGQSCTCDASDPSNPVGICRADPTAGTTCNIRLPDGGFVTRRAGEEIGRESRCGATSEYPCFCNPNLPSQIECPYCAFPAPNEVLICLADGETKQFTDASGVGKICTCSAGESPAFPMDYECTDAPTRVPITPDAQCTYTRPNGSQFSVDHGASLGTMFTSRCGDPTIWPCFCNVQLENQIDCPYCTVPDPDSPNFLCAAHDEILRGVPLDDGTSTDCLCQIAGPFSEPILDCGDFPTQTPVLTCSVPLPNGQEQIFEAGDPVPTTLVTAGPCGANFPFVCNPELAGDTDLEYPYCQFTDNSGSTLCSADGVSVTFVNENGEDTTCECLYVDAMTGAKESCRPAAGPTNPMPQPTARPTAVDVPTDAPVVRTTASEGTTIGGSFLYFVSLGVMLVFTIL